MAWLGTLPPPPSPFSPFFIPCVPCSVNAWRIFYTTYRYDSTLFLYFYLWTVHVSTLCTLSLCSTSLVLFFFHLLYRLIFGTIPPLLTLLSSSLPISPFFSSPLLFSVPSAPLNSFFFPHHSTPFCLVHTYCTQRCNKRVRRTGCGHHHRAPFETVLAAALRILREIPPH